MAGPTKWADELGGWWLGGWLVAWLVIWRRQIAPDTTIPHLHTMLVADVDDVAGSDALLARYLNSKK